MLMLTKQGVHYHLRVGPDEVRLYDEPAMPGPYVDIIFDDIDDAHNATVGVVEELLPDYLDAEESDEAYEFSEQITTAVKLGDTDGEAWNVDDLGHAVEFRICAGCRPWGMN